MVGNGSTKLTRAFLPRAVGICALVGAYAAADAVILGATSTPAQAWRGGGGGGRGWGGGGWGGHGWAGRGAWGPGWGRGGWGYRRGWGYGYGYGDWAPATGLGVGWGAGGNCWWWNGWDWVYRC